MSGAQAAAASGCCCRPLIGCPCDNPNRPGAIFDASLSSVLVSMDVSVNHSFYDDRSAYPACPGQGCGCTGQVVAWPYAYQHQGRGVQFDETCFCAKNDCPGCYPFHLNATASNAILRRNPHIGAEMVRTVSVGTLDHVIGTWSWQPYQAAYCAGNDGSRVRRYCRFPYLDVVGGLRSGVEIDPNGQYIGVNGEYTTGLYGSNTGSVCAVIDIGIGRGFNCDYLARVSVVYMSIASLLDVVNADGTVPAYLLPQLELTWYYRKPCLSPSDTMLGTYIRDGDADIERYRTDQDCGPSHYFDDLRATAGDTLTVS